MADGITWKTEGFDEFEKILIKMGEDVKYDKGAKILVKAAKIAMQPVADMMRELIPYDMDNKEGEHMRDTIRVSARITNAKDKRSIYYQNGDVVVGEVSIKTDKRGISQEFGNGRNPAHPFLRPSIEWQVDKIVNILGTYLAFELDKYSQYKDNT